MMKLRPLLLLTLALAAGGCGHTASIPVNAPLVVAAAPQALCEQIQAGLKPLLAKETELVRADSQGGVILRGTTKGADGSVRLVEVRLTAVPGGAATKIAISSTKFAFVTQPAREQTDLDVETAFLQAITQTLNPATVSSGAAQTN